MKKTVEFKCFGKDDYLYLDIGLMAAMERATGKAIAEIPDLMVSGRFGVDLLLRTLPIALADCRQVDDIEKEMNNAVANGYSIQAMTQPLFKTISETGIFGKAVGKPKAQEKAQEQSEG